MSGKARPVPVDKLGAAEAKAEIAQLVADIAHHDALYYRQDAPEISVANSRRRHRVVQSATISVK